ncbi:MAG: hypothetical protein WCQ60_01180 [bacterium]
MNKKIIWGIVIVVVVIIAGVMVSFQSSQTTDGGRLLKIAQMVVIENFKEKTPVRCLDFKGVKDSESITYNITRVFNDSCPKDPTADYPAIPSIKINFASGAVSTANSEGVFTPLTITN